MRHTCPIVVTIALLTAASTVIGASTGWAQTAPPTLQKLTPTVAPRGTQVTVTIAGTNIGAANAVSNIVPTDSNGIAYSRSVQQVHNIAYLNATGANRTRGGFFPAGTNNPNPAFTVGLG